MHAPHTVGACKLESACTGAGLYRRWVPAPEMPRARFLRLRMLDRIKTAHPYEDFITIGPNKSKDMRCSGPNKSNLKDIHEPENGLSDLFEELENLPATPTPQSDQSMATLLS